MKIILLLSTLLITFASTSFAQMTMPGMDHNKTPMTGSSTAGPSMNMSSNMGNLAKLSGKAFERAFLSMMIPHHQAAIDMSKAVLPLAKDATVQKWAKAIIAAQESEIAQMNTLLKAYGGSDTKMATMMMDGMKGMGMRVKASGTPDMTFVQDMIGHHASALDMARVALQKASNPAVLKLARDIATAQAGEMYDFQLWLQKR